MGEPPLDRRKAIVRDGYNAVADGWGRARRTGPPDPRERVWIEQFLAVLPIGARVLDLGCGSGAPILVELVEHGYQLTGVDFSHEQVARARERCPTANVLQADLTEIKFEAGSFDGVIAFDSIWHVPRPEHARVFKRIREWLAPGGVALLTLGATDDGENELFTELLGAPMYYDAVPEAMSLKMLADTGFSVVGHHLKPIVESRPKTGHLIILVKVQ